MSTKNELNLLRYRNVTKSLLFAVFMNYFSLFCLLIFVLYLLFLFCYFATLAVSRLVGMCLTQPGNGSGLLPPVLLNSILGVFLYLSK